MAHTWQTRTVTPTGNRPQVAVYPLMERGTVIGTLEGGQTAQARLGGTGWYQVLLADGVIGYVCKADAVLVSTETAGVG